MRSSAPDIPLWPLPLLITLLFLLAAHLAYAISIAEQHVPACMPYLEGCVSISRASRHGLGNHLFRLLVIPCAVLHALTWWLSRRWLTARSAHLRSLALMQGLGLASAFALAVYASFLGTQGEVYGFLRRYGVTVYFGFGFVAQLLLMRQASRVEAITPRIARVMACICVAMLMLGLGNVAAGALVGDHDLRDRIENALEWQLGLLMVGWYAMLARAWKRGGLAMRLVAA